MISNERVQARRSARKGPSLVVAAGESRSPGQSTYEVVCSGCHRAGTGGAQMLSDPAQWTDVLARPRDEVYRRVIEGYGGMPERGTCYRCSDELLQQTVDWMLERVSNPSSRERDAPVED